MANKMATASPYFDDLRGKPEVIDPPSSDDMVDVVEHVMDPSQSATKPNLTVSSSVNELLECPVCLIAMYPPIHQVRLFLMLAYLSLYCFLVLVWTSSVFRKCS